VRRQKQGREGTHSDVQAVELSGKVEGCVAFIGKVGVLKVAGVVLDDALDEGEVVEVDGAAEADRDVDPVYSNC
jgi:hypothetical protein